MLNDVKGFMGKHFELIDKDHKYDQVEGMDIAQRPPGSQWTEPFSMNPVQRE